MSNTAVRVTESLFETARIEAAIEHRSVAKQIEYWAELGRSVSRHIRPGDLLALQQGLTHLKFETNPVPPVSLQQVLQELEADRASGNLQRRIRGNAEVIYAASLVNPGGVVAVYADGRRVEGFYRDHGFEPAAQ